jgi:hypothetical protein
MHCVRVRAGAGDLPCLGCGYVVSAGIAQLAQLAGLSPTPGRHPMTTTPSTELVPVRLVFTDASGSPWLGSSLATGV